MKEIPSSSHTIFSPAFQITAVKAQIMEHAGNLSPDQISQISSVLDKYGQDSGIHFFTNRESSRGPRGFYLFIPSGKLEETERSYRVTYFDGVNSIQIRDINFLPKSYIGKRSGKHMPEDISLEDRMEMVIECWNRPEEVFRRNEYHRNYSIDYLFDSYTLSSVGRHARASLSATIAHAADRRDPSEARKSTLIIENLLWQADLDSLKQAIDRFRSFMDSETLCIMEHMPGTQTRNIYQFLTPETEEKISVQTSTGSKPRKIKVLDAGIANLRREFFSEFPLASYAMDTTKDMRNIPALRLLEEKKSVNDAAVLLFSNSFLKADNSVLDILRGKNENDLGTYASQQIRKIAPYLQFIGKNEELSCPNTTEDWEAFARIVDVDQFLSERKFRLPGHTVKEFSEMIKNGTYSGWEEVVDTYFPFDTDIPDILSDMMAMVNRVGVSCVGSLAVNMLSGRNLDIDPQDVLAFCLAQSPGERTYKIGGKASKILEQPQILSIPGQIYSGVYLPDLMNMGQRYKNDHDIFENILSRYAIRDAFTQAGAKQTWQGIEITPDTMSIFKGKGYAIESISSASQGFNVAFRLANEDSARVLMEVPYDPIHLIGVYNISSGHQAAMAVLREDEEQELLQLSLQDIHFYRGAEPKGGNEIPALVDAFVNEINVQELRRSTFVDSRTRLRRQAERRAGILGIVGYDFNDVDQNVGVMNQLRSFIPSAYWSLNEEKGHIDSDRIRGYVERVFRLLKGDEDYKGPRLVVSNT